MVNDKDNNPKLNPTAINPKLMVLTKSSDLIKKGEIIPTENQAAAIVFKNSDKTFSWLVVKFLISQRYYTAETPSNRKILGLGQIES